MAAQGAVLGGVLDLVLVTSVMNEEGEQGSNLPPLDTLTECPLLWNSASELFCRQQSGDTAATHPIA